LSKNNYAELELSVFLISCGERSDVDNHLETKKIFCWGSSVVILCDTLLQSCSFWWVL